MATDKLKQGYLPYYEIVAADLGPAAKVVELGVLKGESLELFQQMFPDSPIIVGVDANSASEWPEGTVQILQWQQSPDLHDELAELSPEWDLIVDDASHIGGLTRESFKNLWPLVRPGGYYIVEDWHVGFGHHHLYLDDNSMLLFAQDLLYGLDNGHSGLSPDFGNGTESIVYVDGMIILKKRDILGKVTT